MNIRQCILLVIALCSSYVIFGQTKTTIDTAITAEDAKASPTNLAKAKFQINDIKNRGIIVRLKTNKDRIEAYRREGYKKVADKLEESSRNTNLRLTYAFITKWTYSPVYFMESQYTRLLLLHDTLMAKTYDLQRDTAIYVNRDSFYIADYGDLMGTQLQNGQINRTEQSTTPVDNDAIVIKDHQQSQLQAPMPFAAMAGLLGTYSNLAPATFSSIGTMPGSSVPMVTTGGNESTGEYLHKNNYLRDPSLPAPDTLMLASRDTSISPYDRLSRYLVHIDGARVPPHKDSVNKYIDRIYDDIEAHKYSDKYTRITSRLNYKLIEYYCKRLSKDRNLICNDDIIYWWHRNPNIRYLTAIPLLRQQLSSITDKEPSPPHMEPPPHIGKY
ncbi:MAG: hypothetical protein JWO03_2223 [Bacteroidetes bacterium]|nr:hypothetical protein [Bacteroidota bacterium]